MPKAFLRKREAFKVPKCLAQLCLVLNKEKTHPYKYSYFFFRSTKKKNYKINKYVNEDRLSEISAYKIQVSIQMIIKKIFFFKMSLKNAAD